MTDLPTKYSEWDALKGNKLQAAVIQLGNDLEIGEFGIMALLSDDEKVITTSHKLAILSALANEKKQYKQQSIITTIPLVVTNAANQP